MLVTRAFVATLTLYLLLRIKGVPIRLPAPRQNQALALGVLFSSYSYGVLAAIELMPVGLAVVTFYTYPLMVAGLAWWRGEQAFNARTASALVIAFGGIVLALDVFGAHPHPLGIALALASAVMVTLVLNLNNRLRGESDSRPITLHMLLAATLVFAIAVVARHAFALPQTMFGWLGLLGAPAFYAVAVVSFFEIVKSIGPLKMSLIMNIEPVAAVIFGFLLLDQALSTTQMLGVVLVIGAVVLIEGASLVKRS